jgi:hypothetical protein
VTSEVQNLRIGGAPVAPKTDTTDGREKQNLSYINTLQSPFPLASPLLITGMKGNP